MESEKHHNKTFNRSEEPTKGKTEMFVKINRVNEKNHVKEIVVDTNEIVFVSETEPHINYDDPIEWETKFDDELGQVQIATKWSETPRYVIAFKNGRHPQFLDKENYDKLVEILLSNK